jgi:general L-amino acid transport system substrate-binding protein
MRLSVLLAGLLSGLVASAACGAATLDTVKARGELVCGVSPGVPGFSLPDQQGNWTGLDVDFCRAVAAAIFDDPTKVKFVPLDPKDRFTALASATIDILSRQATWTLQRDTQLGLHFSVIDFYDGQAMMVRKSLKVATAKDFNDASVCVQGGTTTQLNLADYFRINDIKYEPVNFASGDEASKAFEAGRCDVFTTDASALFAYRLKLSNPDDFVVLPERISKEPLGPVVRRGDEAWADLVKWVHFAMVDAEELGLTSANVDEALKSANPEIKRFLGVEDNLGTGLGVPKDWAYRIVKKVGNYGEVYDRNFGPSTKLAIPRGLNNLWTKGGLQYAPPVR